MGVPQLILFLIEGAAIASQALLLKIVYDVLKNFRQEISKDLILTIWSGIRDMATELVVLGITPLRSRFL
jgi:hypothetical protein